MTLTPSQTLYARRREERLLRIAAAAVASPLSQPQRQPEIVVLPPVPPEPTPPAAVRVMWFENEGKITVARVKHFVAADFGVTVAELDSPQRGAKVALPRQIAYLLAKKLTGQSLTFISRRFGGRDHTSVLHGIRKIELMMAADQELTARVAAIAESITGGAS